MKNNLVMILGAGPLQIPAIIQAKQSGLKVLACDINPNAIGFKFSDFNEIVSVIDLDSLLKIAKKYKPDYIMTSTSDAPVRSVAFLREHFGMPVDISYIDACCATNKALMRNRLEENNVPIPKYFVVKNKEDFINSIKNFNDSFIVKPADRSASRGVCLGKVNDNNIIQYYEYSMKYSLSNTIVVEEYMDGPEVSVESFTLNRNTTILTITDKITTGTPHFVEIGHSEPSMHSAEIQEQIKNITKAAIQALKIINGPSHTEVKITNQGPKIVEIASRLGGDYITSKLVPLTTGVNLIKASQDLLLDNIDKIEVKDLGAAAILFIPTKKGIIKKINISNYLNKQIYEFELYHKVGDIVGDVESSSDRIGHIITISDSSKDAIRKAKEALKNISIEYE